MRVWVFNVIEYIKKRERLTNIEENTGAIIHMTGAIENFRIKQPAQISH